MNIQKLLLDLFENWAKNPADRIEAMPRSGSDRQYYRLFSGEQTVVGVFNPDARENRAFLGFTRHLLAVGLPVAQILAEDAKNNIYLLEDLGDLTLFGLIQRELDTDTFSNTLIETYRKVIEFLPRFQIEASRGIDYGLCYPRARFDRQSMMWDLNYFKYYFLKLAGIPFDEQALEDDFHTLADYLAASESDFFLYRDFQSRNIMIHKGSLYFIDYQGGRKGALPYDLASLLFDAKANIPEAVREELLDYYLREVQSYHPVDEAGFRQSFYAFVLIRIMQAMGAYGFRGFYEQKSHFLASIPYALKNMQFVLSRLQLPVRLPRLIPLLEELSRSEKLLAIGQPPLQVHINSFSFRRGIPVDEFGHGGGHVFDCRVLPNPGREEAYRHLTGKDDAVIRYLESKEEASLFFEHCLFLSRLSVKHHKTRQFRHLTINFGCTGGQHRSVFMAEKLARFLKAEQGVEIILRHREREMAAQ